MAQEPPRDAPGRARTPPGAPIVGGGISEDKAIANMPGKMQAIYSSLPERAQQMLVSSAQK